MLTMLMLALLACSDPPSVGPEAEPAQGCPTDQPDLVVISIDTTRADRLGFMDHPAAQTPNLDALAARGQVFTGAIAPVPRTTPAIASLMTGLAPHHHGAREVGEVMTAPSPLALILQERGWQTVGIPAMPVVGPDQNIDRGFDHFEVDFDAPADQLARRTLEATKNTHPDCPLFVWTHFADPHFPYQPPAEHPRPDAPACAAVVEKAVEGKLARYRYYENRDGRSAAILEECTALYDAEVTHADRGVGALLDGLKAQGRHDPIVVFTADHGENLGEWNLYFEHGPNAHDASLRVPLILAGPGFNAGRNAAAVTLEDVLPTLLKRLDIPEPGRLDGHDLFSESRPDWVRAESGSALHARLGDYLVAGRAKRLHCINGPRFSLCDHPKKPRRLFDRQRDPDLRKDVAKDHPEAMTALAEAWKQWPVERTRQRVVRTGTHMLVATPRLEGGYALALYDHRNDPDLSSDVSADSPEVMAKLSPILNRWHAELDAASNQVTEKSDHEEQALRALGYIE